MKVGDSSWPVCGFELTVLVSLSQRWAVISKTQMKNARKAFNREQVKNDAKDKKEVRSPAVPRACLLVSVAGVSWPPSPGSGSTIVALIPFSALNNGLSRRLRITKGGRRTWRKPRRSSLRTTPACPPLKQSVLFFLLPSGAVTPSFQLGAVAFDTKRRTALAGQDRAPGDEARPTSQSVWVGPSAQETG